MSHLATTLALLAAAGLVGWLSGRTVGISRRDDLANQIRDLSQPAKPTPTPDPELEDVPA